MFSVRQKREIADKVQAILRETDHPELPEGEIQFTLHVDGAQEWSWADIQNNGAVTSPGQNPWNEKQDKRENGGSVTEEKEREPKFAIGDTVRHKASRKCGVVIRHLFVCVTASHHQSLFTSCLMRLDRSECEFVFAGRYELSADFDKDIECEEELLEVVT